MAKIQWSDTYSVGVPILDEDHKKLIDIINRADEAYERGKAADGIIGELEDYARYHFSREEEMLKSVDYLELDDHKREHGEFIEWLGAVQKVAKVAPEANFYVAKTAGDYLKKWLIIHILASDMKYKDVLS